MNVKKIIVESSLKPCYILNYCPYGTLIEEYKLRKNPNKYSCKLFGHDCPIYYLAEPMVEFSSENDLTREEITIKMKIMFAEFIEKWKLEKKVKNYEIAKKAPE